MEEGIEPWEYVGKESMNSRPQIRIHNLYNKCIYKKIKTDEVISVMKSTSKFSVFSISDKKIVKKKGQ